MAKFIVHSLQAQATSIFPQPSHFGGGPSGHWHALAGCQQRLHCARSPLQSRHETPLTSKPGVSLQCGQVCRLGFMVSFTPLLAGLGFLLSQTLLQPAKALAPADVALEVAVDQ